jgi:heterodisulfide reductase subunit C
LAYCIVPNNEFYQLADKQIFQLNSELEVIRSSLKLNPSNETVQKLKSNLEQEIKLIKQRIAFFKKLENSGSILYSNNQRFGQITPYK